MKKLLLISLATLTVAACAPRDTTHYYSIQEALNSPQAAGVVDPNIKLYFGKSVSGKVVKSGLVSNKKTNFANKSDQEGCTWAFLSAVKQFQERAKAEGATKVSNLVSYYKKNTYNSTTNYECHAGRVVGGVTLKGDLVK
ncbi:excinuclease ABC subunit A [Testudinibacter sp. P80/BLE/0925]|uniref:excinuclease ABC subunit A n=1 Tax=Testudinibacter sp. TW-1 TaxID=3417757 RepID=UPI003D36FBDC